MEEDEQKIHPDIKKNMVLQIKQEVDRMMMDRKKFEQLYFIAMFRFGYLTRYFSRLGLVWADHTRS